MQGASLPVCIGLRASACAARPVPLEDTAISTVSKSACLQHAPGVFHCEPFLFDNPGVVTTALNQIEFIRGQENDLAKENECAWPWPADAVMAVNGM